MRYIGGDLHKTNFVACFLSQDDETYTETFALDSKGSPASSGGREPSFESIASAVRGQADARC